MTDVCSLSSVIGEILCKTYLLLTFEKKKKRLRMAHLKRAYLETHLKVNFSLDKSKNYTR